MITALRLFLVRPFRRSRPERVVYDQLVARIRSGVAGTGTTPWRRLRPEDVPISFW